MIRTDSINYSEGGQNFQGTICWNEEIKTPKPGVLVVHMYKGHSQFEVDKAIELAKLGYVGFAIDMYGREYHGTSPEEARNLMDNLNQDRPLLLKRISAALETLKNHPQADENKIGGIGFCFGGKCVLDLVRSGVKIAGVATFHGVYDKPSETLNQVINSSVLILHGWEDPLGKPSQLLELADELTEKKADWQILAFGNTGHSFTNPSANSPAEGLLYNELSNKRAWQAMRNFLEEIFA